MSHDSVHFDKMVFCGPVAGASRSPVASQGALLFHVCPACGAHHPACRMGHLPCRKALFTSRSIQGETSRGASSEPVFSPFQVTADVPVQREHQPERLEVHQREPRVHPAAVVAFEW